MTSKIISKEPKKYTNEKGRREITMKMVTTTKSTNNLFIKGKREGGRITRIKGRRITRIEGRRYIDDANDIYVLRFGVKVLKLFLISHDIRCHLKRDGVHRRKH